MNRLSPWIVRRPRACAAALPAPRFPALFAESPPPISDDLKLFATSFLGGLVFFSTYLA